MFGMPRPNLRTSIATWSASSRVGHRISDCTLKRFVSSFCSKPRPNAAVLPEPVLPWAITSLPSRIGGRLCACIAVISIYSSDARFSSRALCKFRVEKSVWLNGLVLLWGCWVALTRIRRACLLTDIRDIISAQ